VNTTPFDFLVYSWDQSRVDSVVLTSVWYLIGQDAELQEQQKRAHCTSYCMYEEKVYIDMKRNKHTDANMSW
jgi:hypothetical protein